MFLIIIPLLALVGFNCLFAKFAKVKMTIALPIVTSLLILMLYFNALFGLLYYATYMIYIMGIISLLLYLKLEEDIWVILKENINHLIFFTLICLAFAIYVRNAGFHAWDEFSFWGTASKELLYNNFFEFVDIPTAIIKAHAHYPRGAAVYHYFLLLPSGFFEGGALLAHFFLHLIFLSPLMGNKKLWHTLVLIFLILFIAVLYTTGIRSVYNDSTIGLMFSCILIINIMELDKQKTLLLIAPILALMPLIREIGFILALFALIILLCDQIRINGVKSFLTSRINLIIYIIIFSLPFITSTIWIYYFKSTHDFFGRNEHSIQNLIQLFKSFNQEHKLLLIPYGKFLLKFLFKEGSIAVYVLLALGWYGVKKYNPELKNEYKFYLRILLFCFVLLILWRLYLYYFTFCYQEAIQGKSLIRYLGCFCIAFGVVASIYIKNSFFKASNNNKEKILFIVLFIVSSYGVLSTILRIPFRFSPVESVFERQSKLVTRLLKDGFFVEFDFDNKKDSMECYILNFKLAPFSGDLLSKCLNTPINFIKSNIKDNAIMDFSINNLKKDKCRILYSPFMNKINIDCL